MPPGGWAARDLVSADIDRRRVGETGRARPHSVADCLRVREACVSERARRHQHLSCIPCLPDRQEGTVADAVESVHDVTSIRDTARKLPDVLPPLSPLSTERTTAAWGSPHERMSCWA